jgi:hypothetical protein
VTLRSDSESSPSTPVSAVFAELLGSPGRGFSSCQSPAVPLRTRGSAEAVASRRTALSQHLRKLNHRNHTGRTPGLNRHDVQHLLALHGSLTGEAALAMDDLPAMSKLRRAHQERVSANLNRVELLDLLEGFVRGGLVKRVGRTRYYCIPSKIESAGS